MNLPPVRASSLRSSQGAKDYTPELARVKCHWKIPLKCNWNRRRRRHTITYNMICFNDI